jgi:hypothetical protein
MAAEYINIEGKDYRVSHSFATLSMFSQLTGRKTLEQMERFEGMSPDDLMAMMYCAIYMGEKLDGRVLEIETPQQLGMLVGIGTMQIYAQIFARQMRADIPEKNTAGNEVKKKIPFWRRLRG